MTMQMSSVVANRSVNFSGPRCLSLSSSWSMKFSGQFRSLGFKPISQDYPSSLCCILNVKKLNTRPVPTFPGPHGKSRNCTSFVVKATTGGGGGDDDNDDDDKKRSEFLSHMKQETKSPVGRVLCDILEHQPKMFGAAIYELMKNMVGNTQGQTNSTQVSTTLSSLRRMIEETEKYDGKFNTKVDMMYRLVVKGFAEKGITMVPDLDHIMKATRIDYWVNWFRAMHSRPAFEMIIRHIYKGGQRFTTATMADDPISVTTYKIKQLRDLYAHFVIHGYYLCDAEQCYRSACAVRSVVNKYSRQRDVGEVLDLTNLQSYVTSLVSYYATAKPKELSSIWSECMPATAISIIEKRTQEIFKNHNYDEDLKMIPVTITGIHILLLDAVTFGMFLLEAQDTVDLIDKRKKLFSVPSARN